MSEETNEVEEVTVTDLDIAIETLQPMIDAGESEDEMGVALVRKGYKFNRAGNLVKQALESLGIKVSAKERFEAVKELLVAMAFAPTSWDEVDACAASLADEVKATSKSQALSAIKRFAKENDIELPSKPKGAGGGGSRTSAWDIFFSWAKQNPTATEADITAFVIAQGRSEGQAPKYASVFNSALNFAREFNA